jgi:hypothetical protein
MSERRRFRLYSSSLEELRDRAWQNFVNIPHADPNVGREEYRAEIERINRMEAGDAR